MSLFLAVGTGERGQDRADELLVIEQLVRHVHVRMLAVLFAELAVLDPCSLGWWRGNDGSVQLARLLDPPVGKLISKLRHRGNRLRGLH